MPTLPTKNPFEGMFGKETPTLDISTKGGPQNNPFSGMFPEQKPQENIQEKPQTNFSPAPAVKSWENMSWVDKLKAVIKEVPSAAGQVRSEITKMVSETPILGVKPAYAPAQESDANKLQEDYNKSLIGKYTHKEEISKGNFVSGLTGGLIKPETEAPRDITDKIVGGISNIAGSAMAIQSIGAKLGALALGNQTIAQAVLKYPTVAKYVFPLAKNAVAFDIYGQLDPGLQNRTAKLAYDTILSVPFTGLGIIKSAKVSIPASFGLGYGLAKLDGASNEDAMIQGGILGLLDAYGRTGGTDTHFVRGEYADKVLRQEAANTINEFSDIKITPNSSQDEINRAFRSASIKTHPDRTGGEDLNFTRVNNANQFLTGKAGTFEPQKSETKKLEVSKQEPLAKDLQKEIVEKTKEVKPVIEEPIIPENIVKDNIKEEKLTVVDFKTEDDWFNFGQKISFEAERNDYGYIKQSEISRLAKKYNTTNEVIDNAFSVAGGFGNKLLETKVAKEPIENLKPGQTIKITNKNGDIKAEKAEIVKITSEGIIANDPTINFPILYKNEKFNFETVKGQENQNNLSKKDLEDIPEELQAQAEEDWQDNYAEKFGELANQEMELQRKIKEGTKKEAEDLHLELEKVRKEMASKGDEWLAKWQKETKNEKPAKKEKREEIAKEGKNEESFSGSVERKEATGVEKGSVAEGGQSKGLKSEKTLFTIGGGENASIGRFRDDTPFEMGGFNKIRIIEFPEMVDIARELQGKVPTLKKFPKAFGRFYGRGQGEIKLNPILFKKENLGQLAKTLAHELGHLTDWLPDKTLKRGNVLGRLLSLQKFFKNSYGEFEVKNSELKQELVSVSEYWRPYEKNNVSESYKRYRNSAKELYADAISVLFNSPGTLEKMAPKFYDSFFEALDQKPEVKKAYFELQSLLNGDRSVLVKYRRAGVRSMFNEGDFKAKEIQTRRMEEKKKREGDLVFRIKFDLIDKNFALIERVENLKKKGVYINDEENPIYFLEEKNYLAGKIKAIMEEKFNPIYQNLTHNDISWVDFGEGLFYERIIAGDRSEVANPRGISPKDAQEMLDVLKTEMGDKWTVLKGEMDKFRSALKEIAEEAYKGGLYSKELYEEMKKNPAYVTFRVIEHIEDKLTSKVHHQLGTLKDIQNPADVSILKMIETIKAIERNKTSRSIIEFLRKYYPSDIKDAKEIFTGKGKRPIESRLPNEDLITYYAEGKFRGFYVDPYIAKSMEVNPVWANNVMIGSLKILNSEVFRPLFITFNLGFQSFNLIRDFRRFWKNIPDMSLWRAVQRYRQAYRPAQMRAFGLPANPTEADVEANKLIQKMEKEQILSVTFNDLLKGETVEDRQIDEILKRTGIGGFKPDMPTKWYSLYRYKPTRVILEFIENLGNMIETLPKVAGLYELEGKIPKREMGSFIRRKLGSPDFLAGGYLKPATNEIFLFSNAITQGIRSDYEVATDPKTKSGFWWKTVKLDILPKILMLGALLGLFGDKIKKIMEGASEYDRTNYTIVPLGVDENNKAIYFRLPHDETGRTISGIFWKIITFSKNFDTVASKFADVISYTGGQLPNISPVISTLTSVAQYIGGQNPYDFFRGRTVLTEQQYKAGGEYALKPYLGWLFNQLGGGIVMRFYNSDIRPEAKSAIEKFVRLPIISNIVGRFIRVTDYGEMEELRKQMDIIKQKEAQEQLRTKEIINKYLKESISEKDPQKLRGIKEKMVGEVLGHQPKTQGEAEKARRLVKKFETARLKSFSEPKIDILIDANTNEEKMELLKSFRGSMGEKEFDEMKNLVIKEKIVSPEVFAKLKAIH